MATRNNAKKTGSRNRALGKRTLKRVSGLEPGVRKLFESARAVRKNAYAPYSHFKVGAALRDNRGRIFTGCNVENASYGGTQCAERAAITAMVASGARDVKEIVIVTDTPEGCPPCGFCRQVTELDIEETMLKPPPDKRVFDGIGNAACLERQVLKRLPW